MRQTRNKSGAQRGETAEAREARIAATYEQALLCIQRGERGEAVVRHVLRPCSRPLPAHFFRRASRQGSMPWTQF